jgi:hypothetical protein
MSLRRASPGHSSHAPVTVVTGIVFGQFDTVPAEKRPESVAVVLT